MAEAIVHEFKVIITGPKGVGKTSLITRLSKNTFLDHVSSTIGVDFQRWGSDLEGKAFKLQIWDVAGQEKYKSLSKLYFRGGNGVFIIYDVTNMASFEKVPEQVEELKDAIDEYPVVFLIGNKSDLEGKRQISTEQGKQLADSLGLTFIETSALNSSNVEQAFVQMVNQIQKKKTL